MSRKFTKERLDLRMMGSVETMLMQAKRKGEQAMEHPALRGMACFGGGLMLGGMRVFGQMQPAAVGLVTRFRGWPCCAATSAPCSPASAPR